MNKMKMEDKERKELAEKREEQRRAANPQLDDDLDNQGNKVAKVIKWLSDSAIF
jgi:hypothetical protein